MVLLGKLHQQITNVPLQPETNMSGSEHRRTIAEIAGRVLAGYLVESTAYHRSV